MSPFERLYQCVRSGQLSERQTAIEMDDPHFAAFYRQRSEAPVKGKKT